MTRKQSVYFTYRNNHGRPIYLVNISNKSTFFFLMFLNPWMGNPWDRGPAASGSQRKRKRIESTTLDLSFALENG